MLIAACRFLCCVWYQHLHFNRGANVLWLPFYLGCCSHPKWPLAIDMNINIINYYDAYIQVSSSQFNWPLVIDFNLINYQHIPLAGLPLPIQLTSVERLLGSVHRFACKTGWGLGFCQEAAVVVHPRLRVLPRGAAAPSP